MKTSLWQKTAIVAVFLTAAAAGQSKRGDQIVQIPFSFVVAGHTLPAGQYFVTNIGETRLRIYNLKRQNALVQTQKVQGNAPEGSGKLVFHRYRGVYFLSEIWAPGEDTGLELTRSRLEEEARIAEPGTKTTVAVLHFDSLGH